MYAGATYGAVLGVMLSIASRSGPMAWRGLWLIIGVQLVVMATLIWERTRLPRWAAGTALAAAVAFVCAFLPGGSADFSALIFGYPIPMVAGLITPSGLVFSESHFNKDKWRDVRERSASATLRDVLLFRHIPNLR